MRDLKYKIKTIRMKEETWEKFKDKRKRSGLSWNLFIIELLKNNGRQGIQKLGKNTKGIKEKESETKS